MTTTTNHNIDNLPKWARDDMNNLRRKVEQLEATIAEISHTEDVATALVSWSDLNSRGALPKYATVRFKMPEGYVDVSLRDGLLRVAGYRQIVVAPVAANVVKVFVQEVD